MKKMRKIKKMKNCRCLFMALVLGLACFLPTGCIKLTATTSLSVNPFSQWALLEGIDLTPLAQQLAANIAVTAGMPTEGAVDDLPGIGGRF